MDTPHPLAGKVLVLFDGVCNLCNGFVQFVIQRDPSARFMFASLQSESGRQQLIKFGINPDVMNSLVIIDNDKAYLRSSGVLRVAGYLPGGWPAVKVFKIIPTGIRDWLYNLIAASRYRWFGKRDSCWLPTPSLKARFLD